MPGQRTLDKNGGVVVVLVLLFVICLPATSGSFSVFHEWSRRLTDYVGSNPLARSLLKNPNVPTTQSLISAQGYPVETHVVTTEDGFLIELHRIPFGVNMRRWPNSTRIPVVLFHGNAQSSADWVVNQPVSDAFGFYLADCGFDVWLANQRGNDYSNKHVKYNLGESAFWDYSVHEIGVYDLASIVDYVTGTTGQPKVHFIGFSLSNAALMVLLSKRPEYNQRIGVGVLMAPGGIFYDGFLFGVARLVSPAASIYGLFGNLIGGLPTIPPFATGLLHRILPVICHKHVDIFGVCLNVLYAMFGHDFGLITKDKMSLITSVAPSPFSVKTIFHGLQQAGFGEFTEYDYGVSENHRVYGRPTPPAYNLSAITAPIGIFVGPKDYHASPKDARRLAKRLPNVVHFHSVNYPFFRHLDFCYSRGVGELVYARVVHLMDAFSWT